MNDDIYCKNCGEVVKPDAKFCQYCGGALDIDIETMSSDLFCKNCGRVTAPEAKFCEYCGTTLNTNILKKEKIANPSQTRYNATQYGHQIEYPSYQQSSQSWQAPYVAPNQPTLPRKSPAVSAILSLLIAGLGQIYLGRFWRGVAWFVGGIILGLLTMGILAIFIWIGAAIDAYMVAKDYNRKLGYVE